MKIYGHPHSASTRKVLLALEEKASFATLVPVDLATGQHKRPAHLALHPYGKVPVLEHDGFVLYESPAIIRYLDAVLPGPSLTPACPALRARMDQWLSVEASYVGGPSWAIMSQLVTGPMFGQKPDSLRVEQGRRELSHTLDVLDRALRGRSFLAGESFSLADITFLPCLQFLQDVGQLDLIELRPSLNGWWLRMQTRPSWQKVLATRVLEAPCLLRAPDATSLSSAVN